MSIVLDLFMSTREQAVRAPGNQILLTHGELNIMTDRAISLLKDELETIGDIIKPLQDRLDVLNSDRLGLEQAIDLLENRDNSQNTKPISEPEPALEEEEEPEFKNPALERLNKFIKWLVDEGATDSWVCLSYQEISEALDVSPASVKLVIDDAVGSNYKLRVHRVLSGNHKGNN